MKNYIEKLVRKASQSNCQSRIAAIGFNKKGDCVAIGYNKKRFLRKGGGVHAEIEIFKVARKRGVVKILICRIGKGKELRPIEPCSNCKKIALKLNIKIETILS
ncbi:MAG: hypothetical protein DRI98_11355 [Bacteroidetes bacterium]|nr:MAG: hypothetical protein DRI98_11355 [Bacteroidota bacterium]